MTVFLPEEPHKGPHLITMKFFVRPYKLSLFFYFYFLFFVFGAFRVMSENWKQINCFFRFVS
jgi:hypothetical protein